MTESRRTATTASHTFWGTVSGSDFDDIVQQQHDLWDWGVSAVELRTDLIPTALHTRVLRGAVKRGPTYVAHFGTATEAPAARAGLHEALGEPTIDGVVCHSRSECVDEVRRATAGARKGFVAAFHSQTPLTLDQALAEFEYQSSLEPTFRKIAARALTVQDGLTLLEATRRAASQPGIPVVGAVFGPQRWARIAMPAMGSSITFIVAHRVANEVGGDDEQLTIEEMTAICGVRRIIDAPVPALELVAAARA